MDTGDSGYKKWRFQAEGEPSRSTLWRRKQLKRKTHHQEDELCDNEISQDQDACKHGRGTTSELQSGSAEVGEVMQTIHSDSSFSSFSDHFCLGKCCVYCFKSRAEQNNYFCTIMKAC